MSTSSSTGLLATMRREVWRMSQRRMYLFGMILVPVLCTFFFLSLLSPGLPLKVPVAVVDLDHSAMSRAVTRNLSSGELTDIRYHFNSYDEALRSVRRGETFGFFIIPSDFQRNTLRGDKPTLEFYSNLTYFVPGTLAFKGFKTVAVTTAGAVVKTTLTSTGVDENMIGSLLQPIVFQDHPIGNPWLNYAYYLCPSSMTALLALMIMLMTVFSITMEIKHGTSVEWLATARGNIVTAVAGKMLPHTVVFVSVALFAFSLMFGWCHFPMAGSMGWFVVAVVLFVIASQALGLLIASVLPAPRYAMTIVSLVGILTFSFAGFSYPVESMYGAIGVFSYLVPTRYLFLIYINEALNAAPLYYSRLYYAALLIFPFVATAGLWKLRRHCLRPVYVP